MSRGQKTNKQSRSNIVTNSIKTLKWFTSKKKKKSEKASGDYNYAGMPIRIERNKG